MNEFNNSEFGRWCADIFQATSKPGSIPEILLKELSNGTKQKADSNIENVHVYEEETG